MIILMVFMNDILILVCINYSHKGIFDLSQVANIIV